MTFGLINECIEKKSLRNVPSEAIDLVEESYCKVQIQLSLFLKLRFEECLLGLQSGGRESDLTTRDAYLSGF